MMELNQVQLKMVRSTIVAFLSGTNLKVKRGLQLLSDWHTCNDESSGMRLVASRDSPLRVRFEFYGLQVLIMENL